VDDEVELAPELLFGVEHRIDGRRIGDVAMADDMAAEFRRQRLDALLQRIALIGEGEFGALRLARLGNAPGDGTVVGDAQNDAALALEQIGGREGRRLVRHRRPAEWNNGGVS
jgi:hypothetical protein